MKLLTFETYFNGIQRIVVGRTLHCGTARTKKSTVFLTLAKHCGRIISRFLLAVYSLTELGLLPSYVCSGSLHCSSNDKIGFTSVFFGHIYKVTLIRERSPMLKIHM
mgnify:CR=1 FL=1